MRFTVSRKDGTARRRLSAALGVALAALAAWLVTMGGVWSLCFHPDELTIARWLDVVHRRGYLTVRAYPGGWFELYRIRYWWEDHLPKWSASWDRHLVQDGRVDAVLAGTFGLREGKSPPEKLRHTIQDGRDFNAWLYVLTALLLYAACLEAGLHPAAAFVSGLFFLASPGPLEFSHYCETDGALLVSMAFFAWLAARAARKRSVWLALAGAFAAGFAVACKFTLAPLLLWCAAGPAAVLWHRRGAAGRGKWLAAVSGLALACAVLAFAGYLLGTPALRIAPAWYLRELGEASRSTFGEIRANLGGHYTWHEAAVLRLRSMAGHLAEWGALPLAWGLFSWGFWFAPRFRRQLAGVPGLLLAFFPFWVCWCPFVRRQELLPLAILLAMGAALPAQWWFGRAAEGRRSGWRLRAAALAAAALGLAALAVQAGRTLSTASCFVLRDTRAEAQNWLRDSMPPETPVALDNYVSQVNRGVGFSARGFAGLPYRWTGAPPAEDGIPAFYYVENAGFQGRLPIRDTRTGALKPEIRRMMAAYEEAVCPVRTWGVSRTTPVPVFGQRTTRLVSFDKPGEDAFDVPLGHSRPMLVQPDGTRLYGAAGPAWIGPHHAIHTVGKRSWVHLNLEDGDRWLVTRRLEGPDDPVKIVREGLFRPAKAELSANGATAAKLVPSAWDRLAARAAAHAGARCRMRGDDRTEFCASYLAQSAAEAARELRTAGDPRAALDLLLGEPRLGDAELVEAFFAASALGEPPEEAWTAAARSAVAAADRLAAGRKELGRAGATICGVPLGVVEDFARLKLPKSFLEPGRKFPAWLPPGRYELLAEGPGDPPPDIPARLLAGQTADFSPADAPDGLWRVSAPLEVLSGQFASVEAEDFPPFAADLEIRWSPADAALDAAEELRALL